MLNLVSRGPRYSLKTKRFLMKFDVKWPLINSEHLKILDGFYLCLQVDEYLRMVSAYQLFGHEMCKQSPPFQHSNNSAINEVAKFTQIVFF